MNKIGVRLKRHGLNWTGLVSGFIGIALLIVMAKGSEKLLPVVIWADGTPVVTELNGMPQIQVGDNFALLSVKMFKVLDCLIVPYSAEGYARRAHGPWRRVEFQFVDDDIPYASKPKSYFRQDFGLWYWHSNEEVDGPYDEVMLKVQHVCGADADIVSFDWQEGPRPDVDITGDLRWTEIRFDLNEDK